jgi:hypothetical protein
MMILRNFTLLFCLFFVCPAFSQPLQSPARHVVVIGVDGMSPDGIRKAATPVMDQMMKEGAFTLQARSVTPSSSSSNWASMIMGADVEQHGIHSNDYERDNFILPPVVHGKDAIFPTIFGILHDQKPNAKVAAIYQWRGFGRLFEKSAVNYDTCTANESETARIAAAYILKEKPTFCFIHLDHVDHAGHESGHGSPAYYASVAKADSLIGQILAAVKAAGIADETLVVVSADHGGIGLGHGGLTLAEMEIPFILWGKGVKKGFQIPTPVYQYDNAATLAFAFGIQQPYAWIGRAVQCAFEGYAVPANNYPVITYVEKPDFKPSAFQNRRAGGLFFAPASLNILNPAGSGELRFTLDGTYPTITSELFKKEVMLGQNTVARCGVFRDGQLVSEIADAYYRFLPKGALPQVVYRCYYGSELKSLPNVRDLKVEASGKCYELTSDGLKLPRSEDVVVVFECDLSIESAGKYTFFTRSDDGSALYIDGKKVVDNDGDHGVTEKAGKIDLTPGTHEIRVEWFNGGGGGWLDTYYQGPGMPKQLIPAGVLKG